MKSTKKQERIEKSSGNVFADLGLRTAQDRLVKAKLAHRICEAIAARGLTQAKAAELVGLDQPKISALMRGKLGGFSAERLFRCLNDLGQEVEITIRPAARADRRANTRVVAATG
jgi:predicted XRE-type DNA-binding protein